MTNSITTQEVIDLISTSPKKTIVKAHVNLPPRTGELPAKEGIRYYSNQTFWVGEYHLVMKLISDLHLSEEDYYLEMDHLNSGVPLADYSKYNARIEPGVVIRDMVEIGDNAVVMFGAMINIGSKIGRKTMIDMNVVIGGRAEIGENCHIGAGAVIAGVIEPASADPVRIGDNVLIGANAVVLEGVRVGEGAVIAAGSVVTKDVPPHTVYAGTPARFIKNIDNQTVSKTEIVKSLRDL